jgi:hypothetical protein
LLDGGSAELEDFLMEATRSAAKNDLAQLKRAAAWATKLTRQVKLSRSPVAAVGGKAGAMPPSLSLKRLRKTTKGVKVVACM